MADVVFRPVFRETQYLHHVCSECGATLKFDCSGTLYRAFYGCNDVKFCPSCGNPVIRFEDKALYITPIDWSPLDPFIHEMIESKDRLKWIFHCKLNEEEREKILNLLAFSKDTGGIRKDALDEIMHMRCGISWQSKKKLERRFGNG